MASAIFFLGRRINVPGAYSEIDASELGGISPGATGIVALIGTAEGGKPLDASSTYADATRKEKIFERYRSGDLRKAGIFAFEPSNDEAVPAGAQRVVGVKVNPATQSTLTLPDSGGADAMDLTSQDWGQFTEQINIDVANGSIQGKKYTVIFETTTEEFDDVGGDSILGVEYTPGGDGYDNITGEITATKFISVADKQQAGLTSERSADIPATGKVEVQSDNAGDTSQKVTVYGLDASNEPLSEELSLNGTTTVTGSKDFAKVLSAKLSASATGTVTVDDTSTTTLFSFSSGTTTRGLTEPTNMPVANMKPTVTASSDVSSDAVVRGLSPAGAAIAERVDLSSASTTPVTLTNDFSKITQLDLGDLAGGENITLDVTAAETLHTTFSTVQKVSDKLNSLDGFTADPKVDNPTSFKMTNADYEGTKSIDGAEADFYADLYFGIKALNDGSGLVDASRASGASLPPANTSSALYLSGGSEGTPSITEWQKAFSLLKERRVNIIVPLTEDPAVHAALASHLKERAGILRSEANGYVGIGESDGSGKSKADIKSEIKVLGTRHISALAQEIERFDPDTGEAAWYAPWMYGVVAAGMQAGSDPGEPLTKKRPFVTDTRQDSTWNPVDDKQEMIDAGLMFSEKNDDVGIRFVRSVTTHLTDDNKVFTEMSANESANLAAFEFRKQMETKIGKRGLGGTVASIKGLANDTLSRLIDDEFIVAYQGLQVEQVGDVFPISVQIAPILPINFIPITIHLVAARSAA